MCVFVVVAVALDDSFRMRVHRGGEGGGVQQAAAAETRAILSPVWNRKLREQTELGEEAVHTQSPSAAVNAS